MHDRCKIQWQFDNYKINTYKQTNKKVWRDLKNRTSNRVKDINNQRAQTGNRLISVAPLTDTEKRIVELIGDRYVEGAGICRDSVPMDEEMHLVMEEDEGEVEYLEELDASSEVQSQGEGEEQPTTSSAAIAVTKRCAATTPTTPAIRPRTPTTTQRTSAQTPRRSSRTKFNDEEAEHQNRFLAIAEKQADTMRMLAENQIKSAENQEKQTEATFAMAKAMEIMGKGLEVCAEAFLLNKMLLNIFLNKM
ncbi:uncharacterized protein [Eurosta solidaginis]|uniref:uncharacterized protein n=1 Tax=Eurosta solidaginis TaxID=178769 RepID=UPI0035310AE6